MPFNDVKDVQEEHINLLVVSFGAPSRDFNPMQYEHTKSLTF